LTGDRPGAREAYRQALRHSSDPPREALRELGLMALSEGRWSEAGKRLGKLTQLDPDDADAWLQFAHALQGLGKIGRAREALRACLRVDPTTVAAWSDWRKLAAAVGEADQARRLLFAARAATGERLLDYAATASE
jgi:Flp pilus assembly protein TadD